MPAHSIEIRVDAKTFRRWAAALAAARKRFVLPVLAEGNVSNLPPVPQDIRFSGLRLLLEVGLACTRPHVLDDPARHFALLKYAGAISTTDRFSLKREIRDGDSHKKTVLSDEFGCGFSFLVARKLLQADNFLDVETAIGRGKLRTQSPKSKRPDYMGRRPDGTIVLVEAKGTQSGHAYAKTQIADGCRQLAKCSAARNGPGISARAAVAISLAFDHQRVRTTLFIGDPDEQPGYEYDFCGDVGDIIVRNHYSRVASFIGDEELLEEMDEFPERRTPPKLERRDRMGRVKLGSQLSITDGANSHLRIFVGLDAAIREALLSRNQDKFVLELEKYRAQDLPAMSPWTPVTPTRAAPEDILRTQQKSPSLDATDGAYSVPASEPVLGEDEQRVQVSSEDGAYLEVEAEGPATEPNKPSTASFEPMRFASRSSRQ